MYDIALKAIDYDSKNQRNTPDMETASGIIADNRTADPYRIKAILREKIPSCKATTGDIAALLSRLRSDNLSKPRPGSMRATLLELTRANPFRSNKSIAVEATQRLGYRVTEKAVASYRAAFNQQAERLAA